MLCSYKHEKQDLKKVDDFNNQLERIKQLEENFDLVKENFKSDVANLVERIKCLEKSAALEKSSSVDDTTGLDEEVERYKNRNTALELENKKLKETIAEMKKEEETLRYDNAVESMILLNFKECMKDKYFYDSDDVSKR